MNSVPPVLAAAIKNNTQTLALIDGEKELITPTMIVHTARGMWLRIDGKISPERLNAVIAGGPLNTMVGQGSSSASMPSIAPVKPVVP
jgi:hypothetical protein